MMNDGLSVAYRRLCAWCDSGASSYQQQSLIDGLCGDVKLLQPHVARLFRGGDQDLVGLMSKGLGRAVQRSYRSSDRTPIDQPCSALLLQWLHPLFEVLVQKGYPSLALAMHTLVAQVYDALKHEDPENGERTAVRWERVHAIAATLPLPTEKDEALQSLLLSWWSAWWVVAVVQQSDTKSELGSQQLFEVVKAVGRRIASHASSSCPTAAAAMGWVQCWLQCVAAAPSSAAFYVAVRSAFQMLMPAATGSSGWDERVGMTLPAVSDEDGEFVSPLRLLHLAASSEITCGSFNAFWIAGIRDRLVRAAAAEAQQQLAVWKKNFLATTLLQQDALMSAAGELKEDALLDAIHQAQHSLRPISPSTPLATELLLCCGQLEEQLPVYQIREGKSATAAHVLLGLHWEEQRGVGPRGFLSDPLTRYLIHWMQHSSEPTPIPSAPHWLRRLKCALHCHTEGRSHSSHSSDSSPLFQPSDSPARCSPSLASHTPPPFLHYSALIEPLLGCHPTVTEREAMRDLLLGIGSHPIVEGSQQLDPATPAARRVPDTQVAEAGDPGGLLRLRALMDVLQNPASTTASGDERREAVMALWRERLGVCSIGVGFCRLVRGLLQRAQLDLAMRYLHVLRKCLLAQPSKHLLRCWLLGVAAYAETVVAAPSDGFVGEWQEVSGGSAVGWASIRFALRGLVREEDERGARQPPAAAVVSPPPPRGSGSFAARVDLFEKALQAVGEDEDRGKEEVSFASSGLAAPAVQAVVVEVSLSGERLTLRRRCQSLGSSASATSPDCTVRVDRDIGSSLRVELDLLSSLVRENKAQLRQGQATSGPSAENDEELHRQVQQEETNSHANSREAKQRWWAARFALEEELQALVDRVEALLSNAGRVLLLGQLSPQHLQPLVSQVATDLSAVCIQHVPLCDRATLHRLLTLLLQSFPFLVEPATVGGNARTTAGEEVVMPTATAVVKQKGRSVRRDFAIVSYRFHEEEGSEDMRSRLAITEQFIALWAALLRGYSEEQQQQQPAEGAFGRSASHNWRGELAEWLLSSHSSVRRWLWSFLNLFLRASTEEAMSVEGSVGDLRRLPRQHLFLHLTSPCLHAFPWESLRVCRLFSVSRIPSEDFLSRWATAASSLPLKLATPVFQSPFFLVDPNATGITDTLRRPDGAGRDDRPLVVETGELASFLSRQPSSPSLIQYLQTALKVVKKEVSVDGESGHQQQHSAYVYVGHKAGEPYVGSPRRTLLDAVPSFLRQRSSAVFAFPTVLVMGCSSASSRRWWEGFLHAGAPAFIGCAWDVTDRDVDGLLLSLLGSHLPTADEEEGGGRWTLGEALASARARCKLPMLTGAAVVMYGLNQSIA